MGFHSQGNYKILFHKKQSRILISGGRLQSLFELNVRDAKVDAILATHATIADVRLPALLLSELVDVADLRLWELNFLTFAC